MRTSPSEVLRLDSAFDRAISAARSDRTLGAGQRASIVHALEIERDDWRWGQPLFPAEPISQVIAALQRDYSFYSFRLSLWQQENHPIADIRIDDLGHNRALILEQLQELGPREVPGIYSEATDIEHLERLMAPQILAPGRIDYATLKDRIDIVEYIGRHVQLRKEGGRFKGRCPFHDEHTASFVIYPNTRSFYCFGCFAGGDVIDFAKLIGNGIPEVA